MAKPITIVGARAVAQVDTGKGYGEASQTTLMAVFEILYADGWTLVAVGGGDAYHGPFFFAHAEAQRNPPVFDQLGASKSPRGGRK
jgi:hypothetical protein